MQAQKFSQKGALNGVSGLLLGLLIAFGGIDIPSLVAFLALWAIGLVIFKGEIKQVLTPNLPLILLSLSVFALVAYFIFMRLYAGLGLNETAKTMIFTIIATGFLTQCINVSGFDNEIKKRAFVAGLLFALGLLCLEALNGYMMYKIATPLQDPKDMERNLGRGAYILVALIWPFIYCALDIKLSKLIIVIATIITAFVATKFDIDLNFIIFLCAGLVTILAYFAPQLMIYLITIVTAILMGFAPFIYGFVAKFAKGLWPQGSMPLSYERRADMWLYAIDRIKEKPIFGWGLDSAKNFNDKVMLGGYEWAAIQLHPHSAPLNLWLEGGLIGAIIFCFMILLGGINLAKAVKNNSHQASAVAGAMSAIIMAWGFSYGIWQQWLWCLMFFAISFGLSINNRQENDA